MTDSPRRLPFDVAAYAPNQTPFWILSHWQQHSAHPLAPAAKQPLGFVAPYAQHRLIQNRRDYSWVGRAEHFVVGIAWMVRALLGEVAVDGVETIDLPTDETNPDLMPIIGVSYSEVRLPAGQLNSGAQVEHDTGPSGCCS